MKAVTSKRLRTVRRDSYYELFCLNHYFMVERVLSGPQRGMWKLREWFGIHTGWGESFYFTTLREAKEEAQFRVE